VATKSNLQMSANGSERTLAATQPRGPHAKPLSSAAKRRRGVGTCHPSLKRANIAVAASTRRGRMKDDHAVCDSHPMSVATYAADDGQAPTSVVVRELAPRQVRAAVMLVEGRRGKDVAEALNVSEESVSRWRHRPEFEALMRELLQQHVDAVQLGMISLTSEAITHLHHLFNSFSDQTSLRACALVLGKVSPVLNVVRSELRQSTTQNSE